MKIVQFTAENVKRLKLVQITPKGHLVPITGKNGQGKSSVLDAIWWALGGKENIPAVPIRKGAEKARITLDLGEFIVERRFTAKDSTITVKTKDGAANFSSPQKMLDALVGQLSFDPLEFARADAAEQFAILRKTVKLEFDFEATAAANAKDYSERTAVNRAAKEQRALAATIQVPEGLPAELLDEDEAERELRDAYAFNSNLAIQAQERKRAAERLDDRGQSVSNLRIRVQELREEADRLEKQSTKDLDLIDKERELLGQLPPLGEQVDVDAVRRQVDETKRTNLAIARREGRKLAIAKAEAHEAQSKELTAAMEAREKAKEQAVAQAAVPVEGIGFGDGFVTFGGLPFDQASDAERLRVSVAIAMATNPKLRVIRIRDGSLLDEDSMKLLADSARDGDYQVWLEKVDSSGKVGVVLEDGEVVTDNQEVEENVAKVD